MPALACGSTFERAGALADCNRVTRLSFLPTGLSFYDANQSFSSHSALVTKLDAYNVFDCDYDVLSFI